MHAHRTFLVRVYIATRPPKILKQIRSNNDRDVRMFVRIQSVSQQYEYVNAVDKSYV